MRLLKEYSMWKVSLECLLTRARRGWLGPRPDLLTFVFLVSDADAVLVKELVECFAEDLQDRLLADAAGATTKSADAGGAV